MRARFWEDAAGYLERYGIRRCRLKQVSSTEHYALEPAGENCSIHIAVRK